MKKVLSITGGEFKQRRILCPQHNIRPVMAKVRNSVFQKIDNYIQNNDIYSDTGYSFLDIFSGSGLMAIEAISRGFLHATAVEKDTKKWKIISQNFKIKKEAFTLECISAELFIVKHHIAFDVLYIDPPFAYKHKKDFLKKLWNSRIYHSKSLIIYHIPSHETQEILLYINDYINLRCIDKKVFGGSTVLFFVKRNVL